MYYADANLAIARGIKHAQKPYATVGALGEDCWIGGGAIICPGVTIGDRCVIGAGSVVTKDIESDSMAVGPGKNHQKTVN